MTCARDDVKDVVKCARDESKTIALIAWTWRMIVLFVKIPLCFGHSMFGLNAEFASDIKQYIL